MIFIQVMFTEFLHASMHNEYNILQNKTPFIPVPIFTQNLTGQLMGLLATRVISSSSLLQLRHHRMPVPQQQILQLCVPLLFFQVEAGNYCHTGMSELLAWVPGQYLFCCWNCFGNLMNGL
jgi:hypothetical protein